MKSLIGARMEKWQPILLLMAGVILAFPLAILISAGLGWMLMKWENTKLHLWLKRRSLREGKVIVRWPARDVRRDLLITDLSRLADGQVGLKRREYCLRGKTPPPPFGEVEYISLREV